jgi:hypothetical protein
MTHAAPGGAYPASPDPIGDSVGNPAAFFCDGNFWSLRREI